MSVEAKASPTEQESPYFATHQRMVEEWEVFSQKNDGRLTGSFNSWYVELALDAKEIHINSSRRLSTVTLNVIPMDGRYQETFKVQCCCNRNLSGMSVEKRTLFSLFKLGFAGYKLLDTDARYIAKAGVDLDGPTSHLIDLLIQYELRKMKVDKEELHIELGVFPQSSAKLQNIVASVVKWKLATD